MSLLKNTIQINGMPVQFVWTRIQTTSVFTIRLNLVKDNAQEDHNDMFLQQESSLKGHDHIISQY